MLVVVFLGFLMIFEIVAVILVEILGAPYSYLPVTAKAATAEQLDLDAGAGKAKL